MPPLASCRAFTSPTNCAHAKNQDRLPVGFIKWFAKDRALMKGERCGVCLNPNQMYLAPCTLHLAACTLPLAK